MLEVNCLVPWERSALVGGGEDCTIYVAMYDDLNWVRRHRSRRTDGRLCKRYYKLAWAAWSIARLEIVNHKVATQVTIKEGIYQFPKLTDMTVERLTYWLDEEELMMPPKGKQRYRVYHSIVDLKEGENETLSP